MAVEKEIPYCTIFLVGGTLACHLMTLIGNLSTAHMLHGFGDSTHGWSTVGSSVATSMQEELAADMDKVTKLLSNSIGVVSKIESGIDIVLSSSGATVETALADLPANVSKADIAKFRSTLSTTVETFVEKLLGQVEVLVQRFLDLASPALEKFGEWLVSFGEKIQPSLEEFGTTIDRVQKLFDQLMAKLSPGAGGNEEEMLNNTYALVDTNNDGTVDANDLRSVAKLYGISALAGSKADKLFEMYDADHEGGLDRDEFGEFVHDPSIPGIMTLMLRTYAKQLSTAAGKVGGAKMRDEVARSLVDYVGVVCAKNLTKVSWVAQALSNGSLPLEITADILKDLAADEDNPNRLTLVSVGSTLIAEMMKFNSTHVVEALQLMSNPAFWESEGFDPQEHPTTVECVVRWLVAAPGGIEALRSGLGLRIENLETVEEKLPEAAARVTAARSASYSGLKRSQTASGNAGLYHSQASQRLRDTLLGGVGAAVAGDNPDAAAAQQQGVPAKPVTLRFASWLASNASETADGYQHDCFEYSGESSSPLGSFANEINGIIKKVQNLLTLMSKYATPKGFQQLTSRARNFVSEAKKDITLVVEHYMDERLHFVECKASLVNCTVEEEEKDMPVLLSGAFTFLTTTLQELKGALPVVISNLKFAKSEVSKVQAGMTSIMEVLRGKAPPLFYEVSKLYKSLWVAYFVTFGLLTLGMLFYGFWSSGWFGGPQAASVEGCEPPRTCMDRLRVCCRGCNACLQGCHDSHLCFWSFLILMEVIVLVIFALALVICIIGGLQAFMSAGCSQVYVLSDRTVCTVSLKTMRTLLKTFWSPERFSDIEKACQERTLLTCRLIAEQMVSAVKLSAIGGLVASVLSLQLLVDSAVKHEQVTFRRLLFADDKESKEA